MQAEDFRQLLLKPGAVIGLCGEYGGGSTWTPPFITAILVSYIVLQRHHHYMDKMDSRNEDLTWDTAALVALNMPVKGEDFTSKPYVGREGSQLLLIHRYSTVAWDNDDPVVHVMALIEGEMLGEVPLERSIWRPKTVQLAGSANMTVEGPIARSPMSLVLQKRRIARQDPNA